jgi:hypothetical protein
MLAGQCKRRMEIWMTSFGWNALAVGLAAALGVGFVAVSALGRRRTRRRAEPAHGLGSGRRRIDVVAINESVVGGSPEREPAAINRNPDQP